MAWLSVYRSTNSEWYIQVRQQSVCHIIALCLLRIVDDGSGKIDCNMRSTAQQSGEPQLMPAHGKGQSLSKYHPSSVMSGKPQSALGMTLPTPPKPAAAVGDIVRVVGRVLKRHDSKLVNLESIGDSSSIEIALTRIY